MVLDAVLEGYQIKKQNCFGLASLKEANSTSRWPFVLCPAAPNSKEWVLDYGSDSDDPPQRTNIVDREIRVGNFFTIWDGSNEMTFRVTEVNQLDA